jgi:hypothetical protein
MASYRVIGVRKPSRDSQPEEITHIAYAGSFFDPKVVIPIADAVLRIKQNPKEFFVQVKNNINYVEIIPAQQGTVTIRTKLADNKDILLRLQDC